MRRFLRILAASSVLLSAAAAQAQQPAQHPPPPQEPPNDHPAEDIVTQPARDVGIVKTEIPTVLQAADRDPYGLSGLKSCPQLAGAIVELNAALGPDFQTTNAAAHENRTGKVAEAGGAALVDSLIPFRGLVREISGAAPADRRLRAAINAGFARRGYLRGVYASRNCRPRF
jgi:hypothetical protein